LDIIWDMYYNIFKYLQSNLSIMIPT